MEKLYPLHSKYEYFLDEIHYGTNFTLKTLGKRGFAFQKGFRNLPLPYYDLYIHNVMKNKHGTWKLIDLEGFNESISATT